MDQGENRFKITTTITQHNDFKTDPIRIRTILRNVLSNSFKYFNPVVAEPCVDLNICVTATHCDIRVTDNGIGINPTLKSRVFDMFFRATERSTGTGLGLYIVKSMVEKLNGKVTLESNPNEGTTLQITIPNQTVNE
jgi:signal transduction histidine kinase